MMWIDNPCWIACWNGGNKFIEMYRSPKLECIVTQHMTLEDDCLYSDIILPVTTVAEDDDIVATMATAYGAEFEYIAIGRQCVEPIAEAKSDYYAVAEVAKKLEKYGGVYANAYAKFTDGKTVEEWMKYAWELSGVKDLVTWEKLNERLWYAPPIAPDWEKDPPGLIAFYQDPVKNPQDTPSGKIEFYSQALADAFPGDKERGPMPKYVIGGPGWTYDESVEGERFKKYPLLIVSNHPRWRSHVQLDDNAWLREIPTCKVKGYDGYMYEPVWIHPTDAAKRGIETGDIVKVFNDRGIVLGGAIVNERIIPGAVYQDHGARVDMITDGIDRGGSNNLICPSENTEYTPLMVVCSYLVEVEKLDPAQMEEWRKKYPEAFARDYDPAYGPLFNGWIEGGS
jgi:trimethylamine-N-oxide reductase (cytochrome c)